MKMIPLDQAARDRIATDLESTLFVEAGAGTGKTTSLVIRISNLIERGHATMGSLAAITFTEKAAGELRERLRRELESRYRTSPSPQLADALSTFEQAAIQTIHAFLGRVLKENALAAGLPPTFRPADEIANREAFAEWWDATCETLLSRPELEDAWRATLSRRIQPNHLRTWTAQILAIDDLASINLFPSLPGRADLSNQVEHAFAQLESLLGGCQKQDDKLGMVIREIVGARELHLESLRTGVLDSTLSLSFPKVGRAGSKGNWTVPIDDVRAAYSESTASITEAHTVSTAIAIGPLLTAIQQEATAFTTANRLAGNVSFDDILLLSRRLLRTHPEVRDALHSKFSHILVDEFQDTDEVQVELLTRIATDQAPEPFDWTQARIAPGRLFFVGDPKQSIYRFRSADVHTYERVKKTIGGDTLALTTNFRSGDGLIDSINQTFATLFAADGQIGFEPLTARPEVANPIEGPVMYRLGGPIDGAVARDVRAIEAETLVDGIAHAKANWRVEGGRSAEFSDITILIPKRTLLPMLERALNQHGIPYRIDSRILVLSAQPVRDVVNVLSAIDRPSDPVALLAALRGPFFELSDDMLARHAKGDGKWDFRETSTELEVSAAFERLATWHRRRITLPPSSLIHSILSDAEMWLGAVTSQRPQDTWRLYEEVLTIARQLEQQGPATLRQFLRHLERIEAHGLQSDAVVASEPGDDAVRIMTTHASKGLEFPIVFLAGLAGSDGSLPESVRLFPPRDGQVEFRLTKAFETSGYAARSEENRAQDVLEKDRLLYVAMTRAKDYLVVSLFEKATKDSQCVRLASSLPDSVLPLEAAHSEPLPWVSPRNLPTQVDRDQFEQFLKAREAAVHLAIPTLSMAATKIALALTQSAEEDSEPTDIVPKASGGGSSLGRAVHSVLQSIPLNANEAALERVASIQADAEGQPVSEVIRLTKVALASSPIQEASKSAHWREVFISAKVSGTLIEGFLDLLYERPDGSLVVIDYKTDTVRHRSDALAKMERYRYQAATYALAVEANLGVRPACQFVFLNLATDNVIEVEDLDLAMMEVFNYLGGLSL